MPLRPPSEKQRGPHNRNPSLLAPTTHRFNHYDRRCRDSVGQSGGSPTGTARTRSQLAVIGHLFLPKLQPALVKLRFEVRQWGRGDLLARRAQAAQLFEELLTLPDV